MANDNDEYCRGFRDGQENGAKVLREDGWAPPPKVTNAEELLQECKSLGLNLNVSVMGQLTESDVKDLYDFAMAQRRVALADSIRRASEAHERGKRDGASEAQLRCAERVLEALEVEPDEGTWLELFSTEATDDC